MTEPALPDATLTDDTQGLDDTGGDSGGHPAWSSYLEDLPESVRPLVAPKFEEWDKNVQQLTQKVHSRYEPLREWEPLASEYDPEIAMQALQLMEALNEDPRRVYDALAENFGFGQTQAPSGQGQDDNADFLDEDGNPLDPRIQNVEQMTNAMAEILLAQQRIQQEAQEDAELENYLQELADTHGDYDEEYVLAQMHMGVDGEEAVRKYHELVGQARQSQPNAPTVLGSGGGLPSQAIDVNSLDSAATKSLVAQFLAQAHGEGS